MCVSYFETKNIHWEVKTKQTTFPGQTDTGRGNSKIIGP